MTTHLALRLDSGLLQHLNALLLLLHYLGLSFVLPQELSIASLGVLQLLPNNLCKHTEGVQLVGVAQAVWLAPREASSGRELGMA